MKRTKKKTDKLTSIFEKLPLSEKQKNILGKRLKIQFKTKKTDDIKPVSEGDKLDN